MTWGRFVFGAAVFVLCVSVTTGCGPSHTRAEYEAAAQSAAARANREIDDRWAATPLARLGQELPGGQWTEARVREVCDADHPTSFGSPDPGTITCETNYARQAGFDGDLPDLLRAVDAAARKLGWSDDDGRLRTALGYYETSRRAGTPVDAEFVPAITYTVAPPTAGTTGCSSPGYLRETSMERSSAPWAKDVTERAVHNPVFERSSGPPAATTAPELLRAHRFVLTFGLLSQCSVPVG